MQALNNKMILTIAKWTILKHLQNRKIVDILIVKIVLNQIFQFLEDIQIVKSN